LREPAVATFNKLLADDPQCIPCWMDYAGAFYSSGQKPEALNLLQQAVKRFPNNSLYHFAIARIMDGIGTDTADPASLRTAASYYRKSLELQPKRNSLAAKRYYEITQTRVPPQLEAIRVDEVPLTRQGASLYVDASINGVLGHFILDTGASVTAIAANSLARFKLVPSSQTGKVRTANGTVQATFAYADINLGQHTIRQALVGVLPESFGADCDGLFGLDCLSRLNAQLDTARGCLVVQDEQSEALFGN
jgi:predicted aspartyl protease